MESKKEAKSELESVWKAYNEPYGLSRAEWCFVFIIFAIIVVKYLIKCFGGV